jgi:hypothetical protein
MLCFFCGRYGSLNGRGLLGTDALGGWWLIRIIFYASIAAATETSLTLFKTVETAIQDFITQIHPSAPRIILSFGGGPENGHQGNGAKRKTRKLHPCSTSHGRYVDHNIAPIW